MKVGLIARADDRGIAWQTYEFFRHMKPDKTMVVYLNDPAWPEDSGRFVGDTIYPISVDVLGLRKFEFPEKTVRKFLDGLDVVFAVETFYDWRICDWAREMGVRTIVQGNPEFYTHHVEPGRPEPDQWVWPTYWMTEGDALPDGEIIAVPTVERPTTAAEPDDEITRVLHAAGHAAAADRNGTLDFTEAVMSIRSRAHVTIVGQDSWLPEIRRVPPNVTIEINSKGVEDRWDLYRNQHLVVLPRRYGGLCLPALEAMASGCAILMPNCPPNDTWPGPRVRARAGRLHRTPFGLIQTYATHPTELAQHIDRFRDTEYRRTKMGEALAWAQNNTWADLGPMIYRPLLEGE